MPFFPLRLVAHVFARIDAILRVFTARISSSARNFLDPPFIFPGVFVGEGEENLRQRDLETLFHLLQHLLILVAAHKRDADTLCPESPSATDAMQIGVRVGWKVVVDRDIDFLDVDPTAEDVGCDADALLEVFELFVSFDTCGRQLDIPLKTL